MPPTLMDGLADAPAAVAGPTADDLAVGADPTAGGPAEAGADPTADDLAVGEAGPTADGLVVVEADPTADAVGAVAWSNDGRWDRSGISASHPEKMYSFLAS